MDDQPSFTDTETPTPPPPGASPASVRAVLLDVLVVLVWSVVAGGVGAWVWSRVTTLPLVTKAGDNATLAPEELVKQVGIDGWFFVIAAVGGLLSGVLLLSWRRRDPLLMVVLVVLGGGLAAWLMVHLGGVLGPGDELAALRGVADGSRVPEQLRLNAPGVAWVWPIATAFGALVQLWVLAKPGGDAPRGDHLP